MRTSGTFLETYRLHDIAKHSHKVDILVHYQLCVAHYISILETHNECTVHKRTSTTGPTLSLLFEIEGNKEIQVNVVFEPMRDRGKI